MLSVSPLSIDVSYDETNGDIPEYIRSRSNSFKEVIRLKNPSINRLPSPKPHRKSHRHHKDSHHRSTGKLNEQSLDNGRYHSNSKPKRHELLSSNMSSPPYNLSSGFKDFKHGLFLNVQDDFTGRSRSYSDSHLPRGRATAVSNDKIKDSTKKDLNKEISSLSNSPVDIFIPVKVFTNALPKHSPESAVNNSSKYSSNNSIELIEDDTLHTKKDIYDKKKTLQMIDELLHQTDINFTNVEDAINTTFQRLAQVLDNRRKELILQTKKICNEKKENLNESKKRCDNSRRAVSRQSSLSENETCNLSNSGNFTNGFPRVRRSSVDDHDDILQENKILEPWRNSDSSDEAKSVDNPRKDLSSVTDLTNDVFADLLDEGNLIFKIEEELVESFTKIGSLTELLSSPQLSFTKGLNRGFSIAEDEIKFELYARNVKDEFSFNEYDKIEIIITDPNNERLTVNNISTIDNFKFKSNILTNKCYQPSFTPLISGLHSIQIKVNSVETNESPIKFFIYPKMNLTFDINSSQEKEDLSIRENLSNAQQNFMEINKNEVNLIMDNRRNKKFNRSCSEENDWHQDSNWVVQKGDRSLLLQSSNDIPSYIFAVTEVQDVCAWKIQVTSACTNITLSIGVGTRSGIPDIDERFSCDFDLKESIENKKVFPNNKIGFRKASTFTRSTFTYLVLLNTGENFIRVVSEELDVTKQRKIDMKGLQQFKLYPFCSMIHHHSNCAKQICPRPQITLA